MTGPDDDTVDMSGDQRAEPVMQFLNELRALGDAPAPAPSGDLAAVFAGATPLGLAGASRHRRSRRRRSVFAVAAVSAAAMTFTGVAAANDSLPQPAQQFVSTVVDDLTPFHIDPSRPGPAPSSGVGTVPAVPGGSRSSEPERSGEPTDGGSTEGGSTEGGSTGPGSEPGDGSSGAPRPGAGGESDSGSASSGYGEPTHGESAPRPSASSSPTRSTDDGGDHTGTPTATRAAPSSLELDS
jgi:hypothetical protein